ncbi:MFS transporter [Desulfomicrobium baculatum]|uniref:Major facilitator superfamily MFS_1 n=1 Tax=Desulfomicrobium baculatum (strain DSM 4028 / VKM B-1378 / X) TaxID=525897 RepID=C7LVL5_DESBD|nr:MFS transporter [Desulfomicrobium baculatum]ACU89771.1 major facilitator superfamily MFS_1 [Desulfomicrobium baculatum DSM 4028]
MNPDPKKIPPLPFTPVLPALALLTTVFLANFLARTMFGPLLLPISEHLGRSLAASANLFVCLAAGYSISVLCAGFVSQRLGHKGTIVASVIGIGIGLLGLAGSDTFTGFSIWITLMGIGAGLYMPSGVVTITEITPPAYWGQAFSIHELAPNLAFIAAPFISELFMKSLGYAALFRLLGVACLILAAVYALRGRRTVRPGMAPVLGNIKTIVTRPAFWIMVLLFVLAVGVEIGIYNLVPAFLVMEKGTTREMANIILGCSRTASLAFLPATGWIIRRIGYRRTLALCLLGTGLTTLLAGYGPLWWTVTMLTLQPIFVVCFFPVGFAVLALVCPKATGDLSVSLTVTCTSIIGAGLIPAVLAWSGERFSFALSFTLFGAALFAVSLMAILKLRIPES